MTVDCRQLPLLLLLPVLVVSCQNYRPSPVDLRAHHAAVGSRDVFGVEVVEYARQLVSPATQPARFDPADGLSLEEAEVVALFFNPDVRLARLRADVPRVGAAEAGRWEDPQLSIDGERIIEAVEQPWVLGGMLNLTIPISGRLGVEREKAQAEAGAAELRALVEERRVLAELRVAWAEWSVAGERAELTRQLISQLDPIVERADRLRAAGELDPLDARLLRFEQVGQNAKLRAYEADTRVAEIVLKTQLGLLPTATVRLIPSLASSSTIPTIELADLIAAHPRLRLAQAEYEVAERSLKLEVRRQYPDINLGGGYGVDEGDERVLFGATLPIPIINANRRAIAEARADREVARATMEAEYERLLADGSAAVARFEAARAQLTQAEQELAPLADQQVAEAVRLGRVGDFNTLVLLEALKTAQAAKLDVLEAGLNLAIASRRLESLMEGRLLAPRQEEAR